jgi:hypothetical protein
LIQPGGTEVVQILLVEKDKNSLLQSYSRLGQAALDNSKDKFLVQSCAVPADFVAEYASANEDAYDKLSNLWATVTSSAANTIANKKLHVRHTVSESEAPVSKGTEMPAKHVVAANVHDMNSEQLLTEVNNLRRKYDELVAFSVNLTAERDILNNTLEQTKRDLNRELAKTKMPAAMRTTTAATKSGGGSKSFLKLFIVALVFFFVGLRTDYVAFVTKVPVLGGYLAADHEAAPASKSSGKGSQPAVEEL